MLEKYKIKDYKKDYSWLLALSFWIFSWISKVKWTDSEMAQKVVKKLIIQSNNIFQILGAMISK